ncbi:MAG: S41 family peptidase [Ignavibacteriaceae bacterium]|nr:S41 family peptidase [Ignavibacteriaceae bacterium]
MRRLGKIFLPVMVIILFTGFFPGRDDTYFQINKNIDLFARIYKEISFNYVDTINPEEFMRAGIRGMLGSLDPYTNFIDENKKDEIELITNGKYGGVGITIGVRGKDVTVVEVMDGYSAQRQGIRIGDILFEAGGKKITPDNVDDISNLVKGEPGSTVELKIIRSDNIDTLSFNLIREEVIVKNITYYGFYPENSNNVYLKLSSFSRSAADEMKKDLKELRAIKEINSIVFDLRGNPGGLLDVAVDICNDFLPKNKLIVSTRGRDDTGDKQYLANQEPMLGNTPLVLLINEGSASASEIVAGAIQDHDRGVILGSKSFGKGLVQTISPLSYNTSLKITTAKYYTPSGRCIQKINYSSKNNVIAVSDSLMPSSFLTDNKRIVYSAGGITPDTIVAFNIEGNITKDLLAHGTFFKFADHYYYNNPKMDYKKFNNDLLFSVFEKYLTEQKFNFKSDAEVEIDKLMKDAQSKKLEESLISDIKKVKTQLEKIDNSELRIYKKEIVRELKSELASRYMGNEGRIKESLNNDVQFQVALKILNESNVYKKLLKQN